MTREEIKKAMRDTKREIVIKNLHKLLSLVEGHPEYEDCISYAIEKLEQEPKWIPVSERLPEAEYGESDSVLVCFENGTQDVLYFNGGNWCYPTGETYISVNHKNGWHNKVIAWMPLPKPYEPQESEG